MTSTVLLLILGLALVGNTVVGGLPDKVIKLGGKTSSQGTGSSQSTGSSQTPGLGVLGPNTPANALPNAAPGLTPGLGVLGPDTAATVGAATVAAAATPGDGQ